MTYKTFQWTFLFLLSTPALAAHRTKSFPLPNCGGRADVIGNDRQTLIQFKDVEDCSNLTVNGQKLKMQLQNNERYTYVYTWQPSLYHEQITLRLHSNSGKTDDFLRLQSDVDSWSSSKKSWARPVSWESPESRQPKNDPIIYLDENRSTAWLPECGGQLRISIEHRQLIVRLDGPNSCEKVRLTVFNQRPISLESIRRSDRSCQEWTFRLPERMVQAGRNSLTLTVADRREHRSDLVRYYFTDQRWFFASASH